MTDPFLSIVVEALDRMHPRFAAAHGHSYTPEEAADPPAARKWKERAFLLEFYSEFRRLWDKAAPVQRGLGHVVIQPDPESPSRQPDLLFWQLGEHGQPDRRLGAVSLALASNPAAVAADAKLLARFRDLGYRHAVGVVIGGTADAPAGSAGGVTVVFFDTDRWAAGVM